MSHSDVIKARRINQSWIVRGQLRETAERYLHLLEDERPQDLVEVCALAVAAARKASREHRDPKPDFYASIFSRATPEERANFLQNHLWTRRLSFQLQQ
jgi:NMD protein affecting ribosome stability and mRNA decay